MTRSSLEDLIAQPGGYALVQASDFSGTFDVKSESDSCLGAFVSTSSSEARLSRSFDCNGSSSESSFGGVETWVIIVVVVVAVVVIGAVVGAIFLRKKFLGKKEDDIVAKEGAWG